jgi:CPA2 family monovalent cation:H+ antiporter-2
LPANINSHINKLDHLHRVINSPGGNACALFSIIDTMFGSKIPIHTTGLGMIASCGFIAAVFLIRWILSRWLVPLLAGYRSPQLVVLITVTLLGTLSLVAYRLGLPPAVGAFAAGFALNGNRWTEQIDALILPFRETFAAVFFVSLGLIFRPNLWVVEPLTLLLGLGALLALKAVAGTLALRMTGLGWQQAMGMGIGLAHVGEFAFVVMLGAFSVGGIGETDYQRFVIIGVCSLILTPLLLERGIGFAEAASGGTSEEGHRGVLVSEQRHAIVIGAGPIGRRVASVLETMGRDVCVVDLSPVNLHPFAVAGMRTVAGDASQWATLRHAAIEQADLVVVVVPNDDQAIQIVDLVRRERPEAQVVVRCRYQVNQKRLLEAGCEVVVSEETVTAERIAAILDGRGQ